MIMMSKIRLPLKKSKSLVSNLFASNLSLIRKMQSKHLNKDAIKVLTKKFFHTFSLCDL